MRVAIIEDSEIDRFNLKTLLEDYAEIELIGEADTVESARALIEQKKPDAVFLDIQLGRQKGFTIFDKCSLHPCTIITSSHSHYAMQGFEIEAVDYLLKPVMEDTLARAIGRLKERLVVRNLNDDKSRLSMEDMQSFKLGIERHLIPVSQIQAIVGERIYTRVLVNDGRDFLHNRPLREWRDILPDVFKTLDRSTIINLREITLIKEGGDHPGCEVLLKNSARKLALGEVALKALRSVL